MLWLTAHSRGPLRLDVSAALPIFRPTNQLLSQPCLILVPVSSIHLDPCSHPRYVTGDKVFHVPVPVTQSLHL